MARDCRPVPQVRAVLFGANQRFSTPDSLVILGPSRVGSSFLALIRVMPRTHFAFYQIFLCVSMPLW